MLQAMFVNAGASGGCNDTVTFRVTKLDRQESNFPKAIPLPGKFSEKAEGEEQDIFPFSWRRDRQTQQVLRCY